MFSKATTKQIRDLEMAKRAIEEQLDALKASVITTMEENQETSYRDEYLTITYRKGSVSESLDSAKIKSVKPDLYEELKKDFGKTTTRKGSFAFSY